MMMFHCHEKFAVRHGRSTESEGLQTLKHQILDCEQLFTISDLADPVLKFVRLLDEDHQNIMELLHVFGSNSFKDVADPQMLNVCRTSSSDRISSRSRAMLRIHSVLALVASMWFFCCCSVQYLEK